MSSLGEPDQFRIASMEKKRAEVIDLMASGSGTPWEDAGSLGYFKAFFNTCFAMMGSPVKTLWQIRRPDTTKDASGFVIGCGVCWGLSVATHSLLFYFLTFKNIADLDKQQYWINTAAQFAVTIPAVWVLMKIVNSLYFKLTVLDSTSKATPIISYNVLAYCLAPSVLAIIPFGPLLALPWIFFNWIVLGVKRLKIKPGGAIIATILTYAIIAGISVGAYYLGKLFWQGSLGFRSVPLPPEPPEKY